MESIITIASTEPQLLFQVQTSPFQLVIGPGDTVKEILLMLLYKFKVHTIKCT